MIRNKIIKKDDRVYKKEMCITKCAFVKEICISKYYNNWLELFKVKQIST